MDARTVFAVNGVTVDLGNESLRDEAGQTIALRRQSFAVLCYLIAHADRLVTKDELVAAVWPGIAVTDDSLVQCIHEVRRALRDDSRAYLKTVPKRGYRLALPPDASAAAGTGIAPARPAAGSKSRMAAIAAGVVALAGLAALVAWLLADPNATGTMHDPEPVIAVLPFDNIGGDPQQGYFSDGITGGIIAALGLFTNLSVIGRKAVFEHRGSDADVATLSRELGARYIVEGSVRREGNVVRVTVELNDARAGLYLWSDHFDGQLEDVFAMQDTIARQIVGHLAVELTRLERERAASKPTENLAAYDYVLRGYDLWFRGSRTANYQAGEMFKKAVALDARYSDAYVGLGLVYVKAVAWGWSEFVKDDLTRAESLARQALGLDNDNVAAHRLLTQVLLLRLEYDQGLAESERAIELNPSDWESRSLRGDALLWSGRTAEAIEEYGKALDFNAGIAATPYGITNLGYSYYLTDNYPEAIKVFQKALAASPDFSTYAGLAAAQAQLGHMKEAQEAAAMTRSLWPFFKAATLVEPWREVQDRERILEGLRKAGLP